MKCSAAKKMKYSTQSRYTTGSGQIRLCPKVKSNHFGINNTAPREKKVVCAKDKSIISIRFRGRWIRLRGPFDPVSSDSRSDQGQIQRMHWKQSKRYIYMFSRSMNPNPRSVWPGQVRVKVRSRSKAKNTLQTKWKSIFAYFRGRWIRIRGPFDRVRSGWRSGQGQKHKIHYRQSKRYIYMFLRSLNPNPRSVWLGYFWFKVRSRSNSESALQTK